ncbi:enoyl-CoA hydratase/carnithine racemase [Tamaricihabitans halophyticus]|uniref:Enoyl-CoA hydratase/carnithine racemase n=1 Tax=Tamaricihabitans halophyticus TaxID=1262583 RepID=A0A4R2QWP7_9PSEU|nr:enoyl-CoA hydratase-related protein [Tamaricihabitans halophyticus]TCP53559.1 enoyl-CoA hydratase/carnithine racemase [Tamaricihabitans halophyticus]
MYQDLRYEVHGHVGVLTLDRPEVHNALRRQTYTELTDAVQRCAQRVLVITGAGPSFCSGDDVREVMAGGDGAVTRPAPRLTPAAEALLHTKVPVLAAVNGPAVGWGMELALLADIRIASERARFAELFVKRGLCSDVGGIGRLAQLVGREHAAELLFTGDPIDSARAAEIGLVSRVVPKDSLLDRALEVAERIAANPPLAVAELKDGLRRALDPDWTKLGEWVSTTLGTLFTTDDHREGVRAFLDKREPRYSGT